MTFYIDDPELYEEVSVVSESGNGRIKGYRRKPSPWFSTNVLLGNWTPESTEKLSRVVSDRRGIIHRGAEQLLRHLDLPVLSTESRAPETVGLAELAQNETTLKDAVIACLEVDKRTLEKLVPLLQSEQERALTVAIKKTLENGGNIYMAGCGSSGRLSLLIEKICNENFPEYKDRFVSVIGGGEFALVRAIEKFEDNKEYAKKQLLQQGFRCGQDLLLGESASGGAPYIDAQIEMVADHVKMLPNQQYLKPWLILCNDFNAVLAAKETEEAAKRTGRYEKLEVETIQTARAKLKHEVLELDTGAPGISGSTRMQPATTTQLAIQVAIRQAIEELDDVPEEERENYQQQLAKLIEYLSEVGLADKLAPLIQAESGAYLNGERLIYEIDPKIAITVFTDKTERAPTFSLRKPENDACDGKLTADNSSLVMASIIGAKTRQQALMLMLGREPRCLNWLKENGEINEPLTAPEVMNGFDFSENAKETRAKYLPNCVQRTLRLTLENNNETFVLDYEQGKIRQEISLKGLSPFFKQTFIKMILNTHSTLVMARLGKIQSNVMANVDLGNGKLFARVVRYIKSDLNKYFPGLDKLMRIPGSVSPIERAIALVASQEKLEEAVDEAINRSVFEVGNKQGFTPDIMLDIRNAIVMAATNIDLKIQKNDDQALAYIIEQFAKNSSIPVCDVIKQALSESLNLVTQEIRVAIVGRSVKRVLALVEEKKSELVVAADRIAKFKAPDEAAITPQFKQHLEAHLLLRQHFDGKLRQGVQERSDLREFIEKTMASEAETRRKTVEASSATPPNESLAAVQKTMVTASAIDNNMQVPSPVLPSHTQQQ